MIKICIKQKLIRDIKIFLGFANFYKCFIQVFSKMTKSLTFILKTSSKTRSAKNLPANMADNAKVGGGSGNCKDKIVKKSFLSKKSNKAIGYLIPNARVTFTQERKAFTKALIF